LLNPKVHFDKQQTPKYLEKRKRSNCPHRELDRRTKYKPFQGGNLLLKYNKCKI
jgi:hypothetical protein